MEIIIITPWLPGDLESSWTIYDLCVCEGWNGWREVSGVISVTEGYTSEGEDVPHRTAVTPCHAVAPETAALMKRQEAELEVTESRML